MKPFAAQSSLWGGFIDWGAIDQHLTSIDLLATNVSMLAGEATDYVLAAALSQGEISLLPATRAVLHVQSQQNFRTSAGLLAHQVGRMQPNTFFKWLTTKGENSVAVLNDRSAGPIYWELIHGRTGVDLTQFRRDLESTVDTIIGAKEGTASRLIAHVEAASPFVRMRSIGNEMHLWPFGFDEQDDAHLTSETRAVESLMRMLELEYRHPGAIRSVMNNYNESFLLLRNESSLLSMSSAVKGYRGRSAIAPKGYSKRLEVWISSDLAGVTRVNQRAAADHPPSEDRLHINIGSARDLQFFLPRSTDVGIGEANSKVGRVILNFSQSPRGIILNGRGDGVKRRWRGQRDISPEEFGAALTMGLGTNAADDLQICAIGSNFDSRFLYEMSRGAGVPIWAVSDKTLIDVRFEFLYDRYSVDYLTNDKIPLSTTLSCFDAQDLVQTSSLTF